MKCFFGLAGIKSGTFVTKDTTYLPKGPREHGGSMVDFLTRDLGIACSSLTGGTALCP